MIKEFIQKHLLQLSLILLSLASFVGAIVYYLYSLNNTGVFLSLALVCLLFFLIIKFSAKGEKESWEQKTRTAFKKSEIFYQALYLLLFASALLILYSEQTAETINSPWQVVPWYFFAVYALATALLLIMAIKKIKLTIFFIILHYFLSLAVSLIVYKINYGFDPFIHQAALKLINEAGFITPKTFYYLGQYSLEIFAHKFFFLSLALIDKLLVPLAAAIFLPLALNYALKKYYPARLSNLIIILLLSLPCSLFIFTVPQNLAYLFLILIIILSLVKPTKINLIAIISLALACFVTQPIAGIPACLFCSYLLIKQTSLGEKIKQLFYFLFFCLLAAALPLSFYYLETNKFNAGSQLSLKQLFNFQPLTLPAFSIPAQENFLLNFIYLYGFNWQIFIAGLILAGLTISYYKKSLKRKKIYLLYALALLAAFLLANNLPFNFLIGHERKYYPDRILIMAVIFLLPFILETFYALIERLAQQNKSSTFLRGIIPDPYDRTAGHSEKVLDKIVKSSFFVFACLLITASLYLSYPRFDNFFHSRLYSTSSSDIEAVRWIENNSETEEYIVLANQQVSAAALREFGFKRYYTINSPLLEGEGLGVRAEEIFYYSIPTGGPLYQYYLEMIKEPDYETMAEAMNLAGVKEAYFIVNKYWWAFDKIVAEAKIEADSWQSIDGGGVYIFKYVLSIIGLNTQNIAPAANL